MSSLKTSYAPARRPHFVHILALATLLAACSVSPGTTVSPPPPTPRPTGTPAPTPSPTPSATLNPEQIPHPTGANDIVLRMEQGGGFVPFGWFASQAPTFTLYGDGRVIFRPISDLAATTRLMAPGAMPRFLTGKMTEDGVQALLQFALGTGRLARARDHYGQDMCADCGTTIFVLNAAGLEKVVTVDALSELTEPGPDAADRQGFFELANLLTNFKAEAESGTVDELEVYDPELYRVVLFDNAGEPSEPPIDWPWDDLTMDDFPEGEEPDNRVKHLTRQQVSQLTEVPTGGHFGVWVTAPDGTSVQFAVRPLFPDEIAALAI